MNSNPNKLRRYSEAFKRHVVSELESAGTSQSRTLAAPDPEKYPRISQMAQMRAFVCRHWPEHRPRFVNEYLRKSSESADALRPWGTEPFRNANIWSALTRQRFFAPANKAATRRRTPNHRQGFSTSGKSKTVPPRPAASSTLPSCYFAAFLTQR